MLRPFFFFFRGGWLGRGRERLGNPDCAARLKGETWVAYTLVAL